MFGMGDLQWVATVSSWGSCGLTSSGIMQKPQLPVLLQAQVCLERSLSSAPVHDGSSLPPSP